MKKNKANTNETAARVLSGDEIETLRNALNSKNFKTFSRVFRKKIEKEGVRKFARLSGIERLRVYRTISGESLPKMDVFFKFLDAFGLEIHLKKRKLEVS